MPAAPGAGTAAPVATRGLRFIFHCPVIRGPRTRASGVTAVHPQLQSLKAVPHNRHRPARSHTPWPHACLVLQDESMHLNLYREMGLAAEQKQAMVALWRGWHSKRRALDDGVAAALASITAASPLSRAHDLSLLAAGDDDGQSLQGTLMPMHARAGMAAGLGHGAALPALVAAWDEWYADPDAVFAHEDHMAASAMHAGDAYDPACPESLLRRAGSAGPGHPWETMRVPPLMLGQCPSTTAAAKMACEALQGAHRSVAGQILDFTVFLMLPGEVFGPQELMRMMWEPVRASSGPVDKVELCLQAVQQQRREDVFEGVDNLAV